jgi:hypothetical protein
MFVSSRRLREQNHNPENLIGSSPGAHVFCSFETEHDRTTHRKNCYFQGGNCRYEGTNQKSVLRLIPDEDVGFRDSFSCVIQ